MKTNLKIEKTKSNSKSNSKSNIKSASKSNIKKIKTLTNKIILSNKVNKIIQGGGYYEHYNTDPIEQIGGTFSISSNLLVIIIVVLLFIIGYLCYINIVSIKYTETSKLNYDINNELLNEANILKTHSINSNNNHQLNNTDNLNSNNNKITENYNKLNSHVELNGHRLVANDANNPYLMPIMPQILNHNVERIINPLLPPERSYVNTYGIPTNIPSRGFIGGYQQIGSLNKSAISDTNLEPGNNNKSIILPLYGQPTYQGSHKWNYYTTTDKHAMVKMTFKVGNKDSDDRHGVNELMTGDEIQIPEYNGLFSVKVYQFDQPKYIPFIY